MPPKPAAPANALPQTETGLRYTPHLLIFASSACVMVMELVAGRLTGRHMGSSLYTWTSIIGVVLAGMSIGNWIGGKFADRWPPRRILGWLFTISSAACLLCLFLNRLIASENIQQTLQLLASSEDARYPVRVFTSMLLIFIIPALALGTISPVTAKMALLRGRAVGRTIGSVYAWGAAGSILGTFLAGFWLIAALGSTGVVVAVALMLALVGLALGPARLVPAIWAILLIALLYLTQTRGDSLFQWACTLGLQDGQQLATGRWQPHLFAKDSHYQYITVRKDPSTRARPGRELRLDQDCHSFVDPNDLTYLEYQYTQLYAALTEIVLSGENRDAAPSAFFIGGGGYTMPRWILNKWPGARCEVAEIDPVVLQACHEALALDRRSPIITHLADARIALAQLPSTRKFDLIFGDAFNNQLSIPWHLATLEFHRTIKSRLNPGGVLLTNIIDDFRAGGRLVGAYLNTVKAVFQHVYVFCGQETGTAALAGQNNFIILATDRPDPALHDALRVLAPRHAESFPGSLLTSDDLAHLARRSEARILTDDNAPVENLIAPANH